MPEPRPEPVTNLPGSQILWMGAGHEGSADRHAQAPRLLEEEDAIPKPMPESGHPCEGRGPPLWPIPIAFDFRMYLPEAACIGGSRHDEARRDLSQGQHGRTDDGEPAL